jgi:hypothetical protein
VKLFAWLIGHFGFNKCFTELVNKHDDFAEEKEAYNNFESDADIKDYVETDENKNIAIMMCLESGLQNLAMY